MNQELVDFYLNRKGYDTVIPKPNENSTPSNTPIKG